MILKSLMPFSVSVLVPTAAEDEDGRILGILAFRQSIIASYGQGSSEVHRHARARDKEW